MRDLAQERIAGLDVSGAAIQGARSEQQDSFRLRWFEEDRAWLLIVADGMGGHAAGALASTIAVEGFLASFADLRSKRTPLEDALQTALHDANARIALAQSRNPQTAGMGTTLVAAYVAPAGIAWISVGDSPLWLFRNGELYRLNEDHSLRGIVGKEAKGTANMLRSVLNGDPIPMIDCHAQPVPLEPGDLVVAATDGLLTLPEEQIATVLKAGGTSAPDSLTHHLLDAVEACRKPNQDNCTIVLAQMPEEDRGAITPSKKPYHELALGLAGAAAGALTIIAGYFILTTS